MIKLSKQTFILFLICAAFSANTLAQYPIDSVGIHPIDSIALKDSLRKYMLSHTDTSFMDINQKFIPQSFDQHKLLLPMQVESRQTERGVGFIIFPILILLALIILVKLRYKDYFDVLYKNMLKFNAGRSTREWSDLNAFGAFLLNTVYVIITSIYIYTLIALPRWQLMKEQNVQIFGLVLFVFAIHYVLRLIVLKVLGFITSTSDTLNLYISHISTINQFIALMVLPIMIFIQTGGRKYELQLLIFVGIIYLLAQLLKYFKGLVSGIQELSNNLFHFIVYICTLEIAPLLIIVKLLVNLSR